MTPPTFRVDVDQYWAEGFTVVRDVFTAEEVDDLRERAARTRDHAGDLLSNSELHEFAVDPRLIRIARELLGGTPVYFGYSSARFGFSGRRYHKDNADRHDAHAPDWTQDPYTMLRMGVYLQDHERHSGGLNIRRGSHKSIKNHVGRSHYTASRVGDVVCWTLRTTHGAGGGVLRFAPSLSLNPWWVRTLPRSWFAPEERERIALFTTFGLSDAHLERFLAYVKTRAYMIDLWKNSPVPADRAAQLRAREDVVWRDVWSEIEGEPGLGANVEHRDIPYASARAGA